MSHFFTQIKLVHHLPKNSIEVFCEMKTLINVCGTARSGSTMLSLMLGNDSNAFALGEIAAWYRPFRIHHFKISCSCGQDPCPVWQQIQHIDEENFHEKAFEIFGVDFLIEKKTLQYPTLIQMPACCSLYTNIFVASSKRLRFLATT